MRRRDLNGTSREHLPPSPLEAQEPDVSGPRLHWGAVAAALPLFVAISVGHAALGRVANWGIPQRPMAAIAPALFMVAGPYLADRFWPRLRAPSRWALGMGLAGTLSFGGPALLPAVCCSRGGGTGWLPLLVLTVVLGLIGTLTGALLGAAAEMEQARTFRMMAAPLAAVLPLVSLLPWIYTAASTGWVGPVPWLRVHYMQVAWASVIAVTWSLGLGGVMALGLWLEERE